MQNQSSHYRKAWPQGVIDDASGDSELINSFLESLPRKKVKVVAKETYPFAIDEDVTKTKQSIEQAEGITKKQLSMAGVKNGGMGLIDQYSNMHGAFERNTPFGNRWWKLPERK